MGKKLFFIGIGLIAIAAVFILENTNQECSGGLISLWLGAGIATVTIGFLQWMLESENK